MTATNYVVRVENIAANQHVFLQQKSSQSILLLFVYILKDLITIGYRTVTHVQLVPVFTEVISEIRHGGTRAFRVSHEQDPT